MIFKMHRIVPANTTRLDPDWQKLQIAKGIIRNWVIFEPSETANVLQFRVEYHGHPIMPATADTWMYGFYEAKLIPEKIRIDGPPYVLDIYAFNDDDSHPHEYNLYAIVEPPAPISPDEISAETEEMLEEMFGEE